jgi:hypothetical protein
VDARTTGEEGFHIFENIVDEAARKHLTCAAILILGQDQATWAARLQSSPRLAVLGEDVTFKKLSRKLKELLDRLR